MRSKDIVSSGLLEITENFKKFKIRFTIKTLGNHPDPFLLLIYNNFEERFDSIIKAKKFAQKKFGGKIKITWRDF